MITAAPPKLITLEKFARMGEHRTHGMELVDGRLQEKGMGAEADFTTLEFAVAVKLFFRAHPDAFVFGSETAFPCPPGSNATARKPDVSVVLKSRLPDGLPEGLLPVVPDLAFESVSPHDRVDHLERKLQDYLAVKIPLIWLIYPAIRIGRVLHADGSLTTLRENDAFDGGDLFPGLRVALADILPPRRTAPAA